MDFLDSIEREWSREKSLRMRSWYLYEQFKELERSQTVAAELMRSRTERDRFLRQELNERRDRRRLSSHYSQPDLTRPYSENFRHSFDNLHQLQYTDFPPSDDYHQTNNNSDLKELMTDERSLNIDPHICPETLSIPSLVEKELNFHDFQDGLDFTEIEEQCQNLEAELNADSILSYAADATVKSFSRNANEAIGEEQGFEKNDINHSNIETMLNADSILNLATHLDIKSITQDITGFNHIAVIKEEIDIAENNIQKKNLNQEAEFNADSILDLAAHSNIKSITRDARGFKHFGDIEEEKDSVENDIQDKYLDADLNSESNHNFDAHARTISRDASFNRIEEIREELELVKNDIQDNITKQSNSVLNNLNCYSNFERMHEDGKCEKFLEQDKAPQTEKYGFLPEDFESMSETSAVELEPTSHEDGKRENFLVQDKIGDHSLQTEKYGFSPEDFESMSETSAVEPTSHEDGKCENFLVQDKIGDESLQTEEDVFSPEDFESMSEESIVVRRDVYKDYSKHSLWSKIVSYAYHLVQLKHGNVYNDYGAQILTAVLVCDMLRRGISRMSDLLQRYVSPVKYDVTDHERQTPRPSEVSNGSVDRKFGAEKKWKRRSRNMEYTIWSPRSSSTKLNSPTCKSSKSKGCSILSNDSGIFVSKLESWHRPYSDNCLSSNCPEELSIFLDNSSRAHVSNPMLKVAEYIDEINRRNCDENL